MSNSIQIAKRNLEDQFNKAESKIKGDIQMIYNFTTKYFLTKF